ncbi:unnamed protein product, partial [Linum tenue]
SYLWFFFLDFCLRNNRQDIGRAVAGVDIRRQQRRRGPSEEEEEVSAIGQQQRHLLTE